MTDLKAVLIFLAVIYTVGIIGITVGSIYGV